MTISERTETVPVATAASFLQWTPIIAGALVASAVLLILIAFGSAIGLGVVSSSPTWRDTSALLTLVSGLYLLLAALASFAAGGYVAGRLRERWDTSAHHDLIEFRDGTHGLVAWALAVVITALVLAFSAASLPTKTAQTTTAPEASATGESLIAYELDQLFRGDRRPFESEIAYNRAEAARILLKAAGRNGITPNDRAYLVQLVAARTGIPAADAERRVNTRDYGSEHSYPQRAAQCRYPWFLDRGGPVGRRCGRVVCRVRRRARAGQCRPPPRLALTIARVNGPDDRSVGAPARPNSNNPRRRPTSGRSCRRICGLGGARSVASSMSRSGVWTHPGRRTNNIDGPCLAPGKGNHSAPRDQPPRSP